MESSSDDIIETEMNSFPGSSVKHQKSLLDAEELLQLTAKRSALPYSGGSKDFQPTDGSDQKTSLFYEELNSVLSEERVCKQSSLSTGCWDEEEKVIRVDQICGSHWQRFGFVVNKNMYVSPEEGLFLLEQGLLEIYSNGLPLSFQEAWMLLTPHLSSMEDYFAYTHLCRLGFAVTNSLRCTGKESTDTGGKGDGVALCSELPVDCQSCCSEYTLEENVRNGSKKEAFDGVDSVVSNAVSPGAVDIEDKFANPCLFEKKERTLRNKISADGFSSSESDETKLPQGVLLSSEFISRDRLLEEDSLGAHGNLTEEIQPLVSPSDAKSPECLLSKLQIIKRRKVKPISSSDSRPPFLNVYQKTSSFKKSAPGPPDFKVRVFKYTEPPPNHTELETLISEAGSVPLKLAVSHRGTTTFYAMMNVDVSES